MLPDSYLWRFVKESNAIEEIYRNPTQLELDAHKDFFDLKVVTVSTLRNFTWTVTDGYGVLREREGMDVVIGDHVPPAGGPLVEQHLHEILEAVKSGEHPWRVHYLYEQLHPFRDGNGRSGRALWAWQMLNQDHEGWGIDMQFLRPYYYQTLSQARTGCACG